MKRYRVVFAPRVWRQLDQLHIYIAENAAPDIADRLVSDLLDRCLTLSEFPRRGTVREDIRAGLRTIPFRRQATIGYVIAGEEAVVINIAYRGQDMDNMLRED